MQSFFILWMRRGYLAEEVVAELEDRLGDPVAWIGQVAVGVVVPHRNLPALKILLDVRPSNVEQRPDQEAPSWIDAAEATRAGAMPLARSSWPSRTLPTRRPRARASAHQRAKA